MSPVLGLFYTYNLVISTRTYQHITRTLHVLRPEIQIKAGQPMGAGPYTAKKKKTMNTNN